MSTEFIQDEDRPYFKSGRPRYLEVETPSTEKVGLITDEMIDKMEMVKEACVNKFPGLGKTGFLTVWDDGDFKAEYRTGEKEWLHVLSFHNSVDKDVQIVSEQAFIEIIDERGEHHWVEKEMIEEWEQLTEKVGFEEWFKSDEYQQVINLYLQEGYTLATIMKAAYEAGAKNSK